MKRTRGRLDSLVSSYILPLEKNRIKYEKGIPLYVHRRLKKSMMYGDLPSKGSAFGGAKKGTGVSTSERRGRVRYRYLK